MSRKYLNIVTELCCDFVESFEEYCAVLPLKYTVTEFDILRTVQHDIFV
jgi:uncharacterized membrane protein YhdT